MNRKARRAAHKEAAKGNTSNAILRPHEIAPTTAAALIGLGDFQRAEGRIDEAIDSYLRAIEVKPDAMDAHNGLCVAFLVQAKYAAAASHLEQVLAFRPDYATGHNTFAAALIGLGNHTRALDSVLRAMKLAETQESKLLFMLCMHWMNAVPDSAEVRALMVRAISEPWGRPGDLTRHSLKAIRADSEIAEGIARAAKAWPARLTAGELYGPSGLDAVSRHPLLRCLLVNAVVNDLAMERYFTSARFALLHSVSAATPQTPDAIDDALEFHCALARQCFLTEYVYAQTDDEAALLEALRAALTEALRRNDPVPASWLAAFAAYAPLDSLQADSLLLGREWPAPVDAVLQQQVREPAQERVLHATMPRLTPIEQDVSVLVRDQYERNPYPRWVKGAPASRTDTIDRRIRSRFPLSGFRNLGRTGGVDILVAGCGTGQQLIEVAQGIADARVLAIDLSLASLGYAKRQIEAMGLRNVAYGQADIMELGRLGRSFDVVDCGGVLHHLGDPMAGWRVLVSLLRPDGLMRIALYSELARQHIVAGRAFVEGRYGDTAEEIRRFRQDVVALPGDHPAERVMASPDFFSISECRDLVFHVQEHRLTLPQIKAFLAANGLELLGFEIDQHVMTRYAGRFPDDMARTDLDHWHAFEQQHPSTFMSMYQFWVQKQG